MSSAVVQQESTVEHSFADRESRQSLRQEIDDVAEEKLRVNPRRILESLTHLRIDISRIEEVESGADSKAGGQGTVVPSILLPTGGQQRKRKRNCENQFVAVKKLRSGEDQDWNRVITPFAYELQLLDAISHRNIVKVIGFVEDAESGVAWMLFDWEANGNLREVVATANLEIPERIWLLDEVARGLAHLHGMNPPICHGDLKSLNVLINANFRAIITDFGSARVMSSECPKDTTQAGDGSVRQEKEEQHVIAKAIKIQVDGASFTLTGQRGTLLWSAPEMLNGSRPNLSTDIWAFGWICWEAVTGSFPFDEQGDSSGNEIQAILRIVEGKLPVLKDNSELRQIQELCSHMEDCWNGDPAARPSAVRCQQILGYMSQVQPQKRAEVAEKAYSSSLLRSLGKIRRKNGQMDDAMNYFVRSLSAATDAENLADIANALDEIGEVHQFRGEYTKAEKCYVQARETYTLMGNRRGLANVVRSLGEVYRFRGEYMKAQECYVQARDAFTQIGDRQGVAHSLDNLGDVHRFRGKYTKAQECYVQARDAFTQLDNQLGTAIAVWSLGEVYRFRGEYMKAEECYVQARDAYTQLGDQLGTAIVVWSLGDVHRLRGEYMKAEGCYIQARNAFNQIGDQLGRAHAVKSLGDVHQFRGEYTKAEECYVQAHDAYTQIGNQLGRANAVMGLGEVYRSRGEYLKAEEYYVHARDTFTQIGNHLGIANASIGLGNVHQARKDYQAAKKSYIAARDIASRIDYQWALNALAEIDREQNETLSRLTGSAESD